MFKKGFIVFALLICLFTNSFVVFAQETAYPDYSYEFLGDDKWENFNRKIFNFNLKLNKYAIRPIHILWASIMPEYGMDRIKGISENIEFPIRLISSLIQRDFKTSKNETVRFFTNTILGLGGMFDPAKHLFSLEQSKENMEQALASCKVKPGPYFVLPVLSFTNMRGAFGKLLDTALNPSSYVGSPVLAMVKAGLTVNRSSYIQPLIKMVESNYADPYEIAKKAFGVDSYIKCQNYDRIDVLSHLNVDSKESVKKVEAATSMKKNTQSSPNDENFAKIEVSSELVIPDLLFGGAKIDELLKKDYGASEFKLSADIKLPNYNPQNPVVDSMRTALFDLPEVDKSIWSELSLWNRSFGRKIKTDSVKIVDNREEYRFRYILQHKKDSPLAIIYPSIGEGIYSSHSVLFAKLFYDAGYSVVIQGSHFQWEFVKSMPNGYHPGLPAQDAEALRTVTSKIIEHLSNKYDCKFEEKTFIGTSFGALASLFVGAKEYKDGKLGKINIISICPPIELVYAMKQVDKNTQDWNNSTRDFKDKVAQTASKVVKLYQTKDDFENEINNLPFSEEEGKLITGFLMHQKLSDLIFTIENAPKTKSSEIYHIVNNMGYQDYAKKYLVTNETDSVDDLSYETSLYSIANYLEHGNNYKIYHSVNDYLTNTNQLKHLKQYTGDKTVLLDNGAHLGFMYRKEFIDDLKNTISMK